MSMDPYDERNFDLPAPKMPQEQFLAWRSPRFGTANPADLSNPLWTWLVQSRMDAYNANKRFEGPSAFKAGPMWCFHRFGTSRTPLPDGRVVYVAGEHEDHYDPDFCIYNDVIVEYPDGAVTVYGYPREVFPPTDFHSATLVDNRLIIVGSLGYPDDRKPGTTPVLELDLATFKVRTVRTRGEGPGWISSHTAVYEPHTGMVVVQGGQLVTNTHEAFVTNTDDWALDVKTWRWQRRTRREWPEFWLMRRDRARNQLWHVRQLVWYQSVNWVEDVNKERARLTEALGFVPDVALLDTLYQPWPDAEALPVDEDDYGIHKVRIDGATVRFDESDGFGLRVLVQGMLSAERIDALKQHLLKVLQAMESVEWEVTTLAGEAPGTSP